jgi:DNA repair exonuclease SbcCD ATPase subunit
MFFSKQSSSATSGKLVLQQDMSRPSSPVDVIISPASSLSLSVATPAPAQPIKSGLFSKWQRSSRTSSASSMSLNGESFINKLLEQNSGLLDLVDGLKQAEELNQLTKHKLADDLEVKEQECTQLHQSVHQLTADLESSKQVVQDLTVSCDGLANNASTLNTQQASLQNENNALATRIAAAEDKVNKYELHTNVLNQQVKSFTMLSTQEQQSSKDQADAIYAQQLQTEQRANKKLKAKDAVIRELQAQLKQSETAASKAIISRDDKIAAMQVQLVRSDLDRDSQAQLADQWQDYSNVHLARVSKLEEQVKKLMARFA